MQISFKNISTKFDSPLTKFLSFERHIYCIFASKINAKINSALFSASSKSEGNLGRILDELITKERQAAQYTNFDSISASKRIDLSTRLWGINATKLFPRASC